MDTQLLNKLLQHVGIEGSINHYCSTIPIALDATDKDVIEAGDYLLPYSIGIEWESRLAYVIDSETGLERERTYKEAFQIKQEFLAIPHIIDVDINTNDEQRIRIPSGINGLQCLYQVTLLLKKYCELNNKSGIHYHVDCTGVYKHFTSSHRRRNEDWIIKELEQWGYEGTYNTKRIGEGHNWVRFQAGFQTMEYRIGEMTFDYHLLFKRIAHACKITELFRVKITETIEIDLPTILRYAKNDESVRKITNNRLNKI